MPRFCEIKVKMVDKLMAIGAFPAKVMTKLVDVWAMLKGKVDEHFTTVSNRYHSKIDKYRAMRQSGKDIWEGSQWFSFFMVPEDRNGVARKDFSRTQLKTLLRRIGMGIGAVFVAFCIMGYLATLNQLQLKEMRDYLALRKQDEQLLQELQKTAESNQKQLAYLADLEDKLRVEMEKLGMPLPAKQELQVFGGKGGASLGDSNRRGMVLLQEQNISKQLELQTKTLQAMYETVKEESVRREYTPTYWPTESNYITSYFGNRSNPFDGYSSDWHSGLDIAGHYGDCVYAAASGYVEMASWYYGYGNYIRINHEYGYKTCYGHLSKYAVEAGTYVKRGQIIGYVGSTGNSTGPHLHYEVLLYGKEVNPLGIR